MRFDRSTMRRLALAASMLALAGCASLPDPAQLVSDVAAKVTASVAPAASAPAPDKVDAPAAPVAAAPVVTEAPIDPQVQQAFDQARRALRAGRTDEAERGFKALADKHPELGGPHANLGLIYRQAGKLPESVAAFERAVKASPQQPLYFNQLGIAYRHAGQFAKAREAYERAIELDANYAPPFLNLGILNDLYLRDDKRALELYGRYLVLAPGGDATVTKWVAELKNRKPDQVVVSRKERE
jgi:Flp pilus assembly protein TadD